MYIITISKVGLHVAVVSQNRLPWHQFARQLVSMCLLREESQVTINFNHVFGTLSYKIFAMQY